MLIEVFNFLHFKSKNTIQRGLSRIACCASLQRSTVSHARGGPRGLIWPCRRFLPPSVTALELAAGAAQPLIEGLSLAGRRVSTTMRHVGGAANLRWMWSNPGEGGEGVTVVPWLMK